MEWFVLEVSEWKKVAGSELESTSRCAVGWCLKTDSSER